MTTLGEAIDYLRAEMPHATDTRIAEALRVPVDCIATSRSLPLASLQPSPDERAVHAATISMRNRASVLAHPVQVPGGRMLYPLEQMPRIRTEANGFQAPPPAGYAFWPDGEVPEEYQDQVWPNGFSGCFDASDV